MLEIGTCGLMSGEGNRAIGTSTLLDSTRASLSRQKRRVPSAMIHRENRLPTALFERYIGIDYSGAATPNRPLTGLRIYQADRLTEPVEVPPPSRKHWTRRNMAHWLVEQLEDRRPALAGIDHGFSFPHQYFDHHGLARTWPEFLDDFRSHWPTDTDISVDFIRRDRNRAARTGNAKWRRLTEMRTGRAKSVFHFDVPGSVAKSTHAGLPWLRILQLTLGEQVHFWPFDGWNVPAGRSVLAEAYPALWKSSFARGTLNDHQHDAYCIAAWMRLTDTEGRLGSYFHPSLTAAERDTAEIEGWILGVM